MAAGKTDFRGDLVKIAGQEGEKSGFWNMSLHERRIFFLRPKEGAEPIERSQPIFVNRAENGVSTYNFSRGSAQNFSEMKKTIRQTTQTSTYGSSTKFNFSLNVQGIYGFGAEGQNTSQEQYQTVHSEEIMKQKAQQEWRSETEDHRIGPNTKLMCVYTLECFEVVEFTWDDNNHLCEKFRKEHPSEHNSRSWEFCWDTPYFRKYLRDFFNSAPKTEVFLVTGDRRELDRA